MPPSPLQMKTEALWKAVAGARKGEPDAFLALDRLTRLSKLPERLRRAALTNSLSILAPPRRKRKARVVLLDRRVLA